MEAKMTEEQKVQSLARMEQMKQRMTQGGGNTSRRPGCGPAAQCGSGGCTRAGWNTRSGWSAQARPVRHARVQDRLPGAGFGQRDPKAVAEQLKTSLEGIRQSADFL